LRLISERERKEPGHGAQHAVLAVVGMAVALAMPAAQAAPKDAVVVGLTLEPPILGPDGRRRSADPRRHLRQHL